MHDVFARQATVVDTFAGWPEYFCKHFDAFALHPVECATQHGFGLRSRVHIGRVVCSDS